MRPEIQERGAQAAESVSRTVLFISHAAPADNDFSMWLASRLEMLGYAVWIDKRKLLGGETFWRLIDAVIRMRTAKMLLVYSNNICVDKKPGKLRSGVQKEYALGESVARKNDLIDFIIPLHVDDSPHDLFIGSAELNHVAFNGNWLSGLRDLTEKLETDGVPRSPQPRARFAGWYRKVIGRRHSVVPGCDRYITNYLLVKSLPEYLHSAESEGSSAVPIRLVEANGDFADGLWKARDDLVRLMKEGFHAFLTDKGMLFQDGPGGVRRYFYAHDDPRAKRVLVRHGARRFRKSLTGRYLDLGNWHFAISLRPFVGHILGFAVRTHIVFTSDGRRLWEDTKRMHVHRRKKGRRFFNADWRDFLLAMLSNLRHSEDTANIQIDHNEPIQVSLRLARITAPFSYQDPPGQRARSSVAFPGPNEVDEWQ